MEFQKFGKTFFIQNIDFEPDEVYYDRANFIVNFYPEFKGTYEELIKTSKIWSNIKYKNVSYHLKIMNTIQELTKSTKFYIN